MRGNKKRFKNLSENSIVDYCKGCLANVWLGCGENYKFPRYHRLFEGATYGKSSATERRATTGRCKDSLHGK